MKAVKRLFNPSKIPPIQKFRGILSSKADGEIEHFTSKNSDDVHVQGTKFIDPLKLIYLDKDNVSSECSIFRFLLPKYDQPLGFMPGQYVTLRMDDHGLSRSYSPVSPAGDPGLIDILVKVYSRQFASSDDSTFTQYLDAFKEGDKISLTEIAGSTQYLGRGDFQWVNFETGELEPRKARRVGMISSGTSIAPMYQILQTIEADPIDITGVSLLSFYEAPLDTLLEEDLSRMQDEGIISYFPVVESPDEMWTQGEGKIRKEFIESFMPEADDPEGLILISGSKEMTTATQNILSEMGYKREQYQIL